MNRTNIPKIIMKMFSNQQHADKFCRGQLHAKPLSFFQQPGGKTGQADPDEGSSWSSEHDVLTLWCDPSDKGIFGRDDLLEPIRFQMLNHVNVVCFHEWTPPVELSNKLLSNVDGEAFPFQMPQRLNSEFGDHLVAIRHRQEFLDRLKGALHRRYITGDVMRYKCDRIQYRDHQPEFWSVLDSLDAAFFKGTRFQYQSEYRVVFERRNVPRDGEAHTLEIGDISDITLSMKTFDTHYIQAARKE